MDLNQFKKKDKIGQGGFGEAFLVEDKKSMQNYVAKISLYENNPQSLDEMLNILREISINSRIDHPNVLKFVGYSYTNFSKEFKPVIITEYMKNGSLHDLLKLERQSPCEFDFNSTRKYLIIYGIVSGMEFLHFHNIIHRDLKPSNILLDENYFPKISDLGLSKKIHENLNSMSNQSSSEMKGTCRYLSPEIIEKNDYTKSSNVYAFGIMLFEIITNSVAFKDVKEYKILNEVVNGHRPNIPDAISSAYRNLIEKCWSQEPIKRPTFSQIAEEIKKPEFMFDVDKKIFFEYIKLINEYPSKYDNDKHILKIYNPKLESQLNQVKKIDLSGFKFKKVGENQFGLIYLAQNEKEKFTVESFYPLENKEENSYIETIKVMDQMSSFVSFLGLSFTYLSNTNLKYPLIIEKCIENDTLEDFIQNSSTKLTDTKKMIIIYGIARIMMCLYNNHVLYKNLIAKNILLDKEERPFLRCFETANSESEILMNIFSSESNNEKECVFSYGELIYYVLTGKQFDENTSIDYNLNKSEHDSYLNCLILSTLENDPKERPSFEDIVNLFDSGTIFSSILNNEEEFLIYSNYVHLFNESIRIDINCDKLKLVKESTKSHLINDLVDHILLKNDPSIIREIGKSHYYRNILDESEGDIAFKYLQKAANKGDEEALFLFSSFI